MFFLNLSLVEFLSLLGVLGGLITALYLLDRAKRRKVVSTLRFWTAAGAAEQRQSRRKMSDPWSLLLQLLSLAFLLLALSRVQWGTSGRQGHDHVLLLDTSSWSAGRPFNGQSPETVLGREKQLLSHFFGELPQNDRVMLVAADGLATPLTSFTADGQQFKTALANASASYAALNLNTILSFAKQATAWSDRVPGEIVYAGPQMFDGKTPSTAVANLRILSVAVNRENTRIRQLTVTEVPEEADTWQALVVIANDGSRAATLQLSMRYGDSRFAPRHLTIPPHGEVSAEFRFVTQRAGELRASISPGGSLNTDDTASVSVPRTRIFRIAVYTDRPQMLKPLFAADQDLRATFYPTVRYQTPIHANVAVLDRFAPAVSPSVPTLWLDPPVVHSPLPVLNAITNAVTHWTVPKNEAGVDTISLHAKPLLLPSAHTFQTSQNDQVLATAGDKAVVVARTATERHPANAVVGFDPASGPLRFEVATPLLFADLIEWLAPDAFRTITAGAQTVGLVEVSLESAEQNAPIQVTDRRGLLVPAVRRGRNLEVFSDRPTALQIVTAARMQLLSLSLPAVADKHWDAPAGTASGLPPAAWYAAPAVDLWKWLAIAAACCLIVEWLLFAPFRRFARRGLSGAAFAPKNSDKVGKVEREMTVK